MYVSSQHRNDGRAVVGKSGERARVVQPVLVHHCMANGHGWVVEREHDWASGLGDLSACER